MRRQPSPYDGPTVIGCDVSHHQGEIQWDVVARSPAVFDGDIVGPVRFAVVRTGDGKDHDTTSVRNLRGASGAGLRVAAYHYVRARHGARVNLDVIGDVLATAGVPLGFIALDVEGRADDVSTADIDESHGAWLGGVGTDEVLDVIAEMGIELERIGHRVVVYSGQAWHWHVSQHGLGQFAERWASWVPWYSDSAEPWVPVYRDGTKVWTWRLWQFAGSEGWPGQVAGIRGRVDLNHFRGDADELDRWWSPAKRTTPPPPEPIAEARSELLRRAAKAKMAGLLDAAQRIREAAEALKT